MQQKAFVPARISRNKFALILLLTAITLLLSIQTASAIQANSIQPSSQNTNLNSTSSLQWWEKETEMQNGKLTFLNKPWFGQAKNLKPGEVIYLYPTNDINPHILVKKEGDMIIEVVDDDMDMKKGDKDGDKDSDAYLVDYTGDGYVDRMVDYIDNGKDNKADEMDIRYYYGDGELRYAWFAEDLDKDGKMWGLNSRYEYDGNFYNSDARGNNLVYLNKYNPDSNYWAPLSEDPFSFHDLDGDGESEAVIRMAVAPSDYYPNRDGWDYANDLAKYAIPRIAFDKSKMSIVNVRYSYGIYKSPASGNPYDYDFGFTMTGNQPYSNSTSNISYEYTNPKRRSPKTVVRVPLQAAINLANNYRADKTGFSWDEYGTSTRWEGVFWTPDWNPLHNTGGPTQEFNMRREFNPNPTTERKLYYSGIDKRIHLFGAKEGFIEVGGIFPKDPTQGPIWIRYFDTDNDGFFDRWEFDLDNDGVPELVVQADDEKVSLIPLDYNYLKAFYTTEVLPLAIQEDENFINGANQRLGYAPGRIQKWENKAASNPNLERKRFLLDIAKDLYAYELSKEGAKVIAQ